MNIISCPYCKTAYLTEGYYGWAGDEDFGYKVKCKCHYLELGYESNPEDAVFHWNENVKNNSPIRKIEELSKYLSEDDKKEVISLITNSLLNL